MMDRNGEAGEAYPAKSRSARRRSAWPLIAVGALCLGPFLVAVILYAGRESFGGFGQLPNPDRELIADPATVPLEPLRLADGSRTDSDWARSRWSLIFGTVGPCGEDCAAALDRLDRVWLALGGERDRVRRFLLVREGPDGGIVTDDITVPEGFTVGVIDIAGAAALVQALGRERLEQGRYFVVDPLGNIILSYPDTADQQRLLDDLERLLAVSRVG
jgi:cytochrome oxidase Cu insertion factor (SCO1/SenC/PrrC family)